MDRREVWLHYHYFKNAGTTVEAILKLNFQNALASIHAGKDTGAISPRQIVALLDEQRDVVALSSHHFRPPRPEDERFVFLEICFVRHPLDRLQSIYHHYRLYDTEDDVNSAQAKRLSLRQFFEWYRRDQPFNVYNPQTCLTGRSGDYAFPLTRDDWSRAAERLKRMAVMGVVERFDDAMILAEYQFRPRFPQLDLSYVAQNVRSTRQPSLSERLEEFRSECGTGLLAELEELNRLDADLVLTAEEELTARLESIPDLPARRIEFQSRCQRRQGNGLATRAARRHYTATEQGFVPSAPPA